MDPGAELIARMKDGDETAIEAFVRQYYPSILRYCRCHTKDIQHNVVNLSSALRP